MPQQLVITFLGSDRPGLVGQLSATVSAHGGNWLESRMSRLAGKFAGVARVSVASTEAEALTLALYALHREGLVVSVEHGQEVIDTPQRRLHLHLIGPDRPGIVREVAQALHAHGINVDEMQTDVSSAPMSAEALFTARASLSLPAAVDRIALAEGLDAIGERLGVAITLED